MTTDRIEVDWACWSVILLKPDCLHRSLVEPVTAALTSQVRILARRQVTVTQQQIFAHYDDLLATADRFRPAVDVAADLRRRYVGNQVVIALGHGDPGPPDTPARLRALLGRYDPARADPASIRGHFGIDSIIQARREHRLIDNLIHTSDDPAAARRDFGIWFGADHADLLKQNC